MSWSKRRRRVEARDAAWAIALLAAHGTGCVGATAYVPTPPPPVIPEGHGVRVLTSWPDQDDPTGGYYPEDIVPNGAVIIGEVGHRLHVLATTLFPLRVMSSEPAWLSIDETGATPTSSPGSVYGSDPIQVLDDETHFYAWTSGGLMRRQQIETPEGAISMNDEVLLDGMGLLHSTDPGLVPRIQVNRAREVAITTRYWNYRDQRRARPGQHIRGSKA